MKTFLLAAAVLLSGLAQAQDANTKFGQDIAKALNDRDATRTAALVDMGALATRIARTQGLEGRDREMFVQGLQERGTSRLLEGIFQNLNASDATVRFMSVKGSDPARVLVRITFADEGFDYMEFVAETRNGRTRAVDWFQLSQGQLFSVTVGGLTQLITAPNAGVLSKLFGIEKVDQEMVATMRRFADQKRAGKYVEALATVRKLPDRIANDRAMLVVQASLAALAKADAEYERILERLAERYSDDPGAAFMLMDHYFLKKDLPRFLKAIDAVEKRIGVDGVTRQLRAAGYFGLNDFPSSLKYADESIRLEPDRMGGYDVRASALVGMGRFGDAIKQYKDMEQGFELTFTRDIFTDDPLFEKFAQSKEFKAWLPK